MKAYHSGIEANVFDEKAKVYAVCKLCEAWLQCIFTEVLLPFLSYFPTDVLLLLFAKNPQVYYRTLDLKLNIGWYNTFPGLCFLEK